MVECIRPYALCFFQQIEIRPFEIGQLSVDKLSFNQLIFDQLTPHRMYQLKIWNKNKLFINS